MTPASPAPLTPSGFSGDGVTRWSISDLGHLGGVRHQEVHEASVEQLPVGVVLHPLVERAADALGHPAVDLALDDHRVDQRPAVVHDAVAQHLDLRGVGVGLHDHGVHAVGEGRARRRVVVGALEPRRLPRPDRRPVGVGGRGELGGARRGLVEGVAQRVGQHGDRTQVDRRASGTPAPARARRRSRGRRRRPPAPARRCRAPSARTPRAVRATALPLITAVREANVPTAYLKRRVSPVVTRIRSNGTPSSSATICASIVRCPWPCEVRPVDTTTVPSVSTRMWPPS